MMFTPAVLGLVLLGQAAAAWTVPLLALQGWIVAPRDEG
ncbi:hypothetical protein ABIA43_000945 [Bradyrhizobium sp. USDA 328]|jgi:hypothetical protein